MNENVELLFIDKSTAIYVIILISIIGGLIGALYREYISTPDTDSNLRRIIILWSSSSFLGVIIGLFTSEYVGNNIILILTISGLFSFLGEHKIILFFKRVNILKVVFNMIPADIIDEKTEKKNTKNIDNNTKILIDYLKNIKRIKLNFLNLNITFRRYNNTKYYEGEIIDLGSGGMKFKSDLNIDLNKNDKLKLLLHESIDIGVYDEIKSKVINTKKVNNNKQNISVKFLNTSKDFQEKIKYWIINTVLEHLESKEGVLYE